jgi:hypothetical protein
VILPRGLRHLGVRKAALVREQLDDRDLTLAVGLESGHVIGDPVGERQRAALHEEPHRAGGDDLRVREEQPERLVPRGHALGLQTRVAERPYEPELAVARQGDLRRGIAPLGDMGGDQLAQTAERLGIQTEGFYA